MLNGKTLCGLMLWVSVNVAANVDDTKINVLTKKTSDKGKIFFFNVLLLNLLTNFHFHFKYLNLQKFYK